MLVQQERTFVSESQLLVPLLGILQKASIASRDYGSDCDAGHNPSSDAKSIVPLSIDLLKEVRAWLISLKPTRGKDGTLMVQENAQNNLQDVDTGQAKDTEAER